MPRPGTWIPIAALALLGLALYARGLVLGFVGDDFTLLDAALRVPLGDLVSGRFGIPGYYRPVSRELYFWAWGRIAGLGPGGFHLVNAATFAATVFMLAQLARDLAGPRAARLAAAALVVFPAGSALLAWVSCAQDLIAMFWCAAALLLYARGRHGLAGAAALLAALSKETAAVLPAAIAVLEWQLAPRATPGERVRRLAPAAIGLIAAAAIAIAVRAGWPAGAAVAVWSPAQIMGAWQLPFDLLRTYLPPDAGAGIAQAFAEQPLLPVVIAVLAAVAAAPIGRAAAGGAGARGTAPAGARSPRRAVVVGLALALAAMLPVGFIVERWRGYFFSVSALGVSLAAGALLAAAPAWVARAAIAIVAVVGFGAGGVYRPVEGRSGPARHPFVNYAFFRDTGALTDRLLAALEPWCASLRAVPVTFAAGVPPDLTFQSVLGPGLRVTCRDTTDRVRLLADFTPADAPRDFAVLHFDARDVRFAAERADARVRARIGEGFLVHAHFDVAAACFAAAAAGRPPDREMAYPLTAALAADSSARAAESTWSAASRAGAIPDAATMARRMLGGGGPAGAASGVASGAAAGVSATAAPPDSAVRALTPFVAAALRTPWTPEPHRALGQALLARQRAREAALELAVAAGISRGAVDLAWLGQAYEAMGAVDEALAAYRRALTVGLPRDIYAVTRNRFFALERQAGGDLDPLRTHP